MSFKKNDQELVRSIILDHYENPQHFINENKTLSLVILLLKLPLRMPHLI